MSAVQPKLWSERDFDECCYPVGGKGRFTTVCAKPCRGSYCVTHREELDASFVVRPKEAARRSAVRRDARIAAAIANLRAMPMPAVECFGDASLVGMSAEVAKHHGIAVADLRGSSVKREHYLARQEFYCLAQEAGCSTPKIGKFCNGRDHTTVLSGIKSYKARIAAAFMQEAA